jgi:hypothetical protein
VSDSFLRLLGAKNLKVLEVVKMLAEREARSVVIHFDGAPMLVRVTIEFDESLSRERTPVTEKP